VPCGDKRLRAFLRAIVASADNRLPQFDRRI
jgi:hypothetical protein